MKKLLSALFAVLMIAFTVTGCGTEKVENKVIKLDMYDDKDPVSGVFTGELRGGKPDGNGTFRWQNKNGVNITYTGGFKNGKCDGNFIQQYANASDIGRLEGTFKDGKAEGKWKQYDNMGRLSEEFELKNGKENGTHKYYYDSGKIAVEIVYKDGIRIGESKQYGENGRQIRIVEYKDGNPHRTKIYYDTGELHYEGDWNGEGVEYKKDGTVKQKRKFEKGKPEVSADSGTYKLTPYVSGFKKFGRK